jgi:DNA-binding LacI/PurR family transcriptional regulator
VSLADYGAAQRVAEHLVSRGHRNLCMVSHCAASMPRGRIERSAGWVSYLIKNDLLDGCSMPIYLVPGHRSLRDSYNAAFAEAMHSARRPTAILFAIGSQAKMFLSDPRLADLKVPEDLSLAAFEPVRSIPSVPWCPTLTTICTNYRRTAECVLEMIEKMLDGQSMPPSIRVPMEIALTDSIGPAPAR